jgi:3-oxoacyl-[acyl-carrier-protein] synthase-3
MSPCLVLESGPELEGMHRTGEAQGVAPMGPGGQVDLDACRRSFVAQVGTARSVERMRFGQTYAVEAALTQAMAELADMTAFVLPHFGRRRLEATFVGPLGIDLARTTWDWGR